MAAKPDHFAARVPMQLRHDGVPRFILATNAVDPNFPLSGVSVIQLRIHDSSRKVDVVSKEHRARFQLYNFVLLACLRSGFAIAWRLSC